jgi:hypothetical protein
VLCPETTEPQGREVDAPARDTLERDHAVNHARRPGAKDKAMSHSRTTATTVAILLSQLLTVAPLARAQFGGVDANMDPNALLQNEISLTLVPGTPGVPQVLLAAYNDNPVAGGNGIGVSRSTDGGVNWTSTQLPFPVSSISGLPLADAFDPTATVDTQGNLFVGHVSTNGHGGISGLYVHRSTDGGVTWLPEVEVSADPAGAGLADPNYRFNDRCQITADRFAASPHTDNVYIAWIKDRGWFNCSTHPGGPPSDIYVSRSINNGAKFGGVFQINDPNHPLGNMPVPRVAADGTVLVSWLDYNLCVQTQGVGTIWLDKSTDGGVTWGKDQKVATINLPPLNVTTQTPIPSTDAQAKGAPVLATSPTNANELYMVYAADPDGPLPDESDIFLIRSTNQGASWSAPLQLNTDTTPNDQILPWIDVKPNGTIDVAWYDRRNDPFDVFWDVYVAQSNDGGLSFLPEVRLNDVSFPTAAGGSWMGEYMGLAVDSTHAYVAWTSSLDPAGDVYFDKTANVTTQVCPTAPSTSCTPAPGKAIFLVKDRFADGPGPADKVVFRWVKGSAAVAGTAFGDPTDGSGGDVSLCWYENGTLLTEMNVADGHLNWNPVKDGFKYNDTDGTYESDGVKKFLLKGHATAGRPRMIVVGKDGSLPIAGLLPRPSANETWDVQLHMSDNSNCFGATFSGPAEVLQNKDVPGRIRLFKVKTP